MLRFEDIRFIPPHLLKKFPQLQAAVDAAEPGAQGDAKYHNKKTEVDGVMFDSKAEAARYQELKLLKRAGAVLEIELQPRFTLQEGYVDGISGRWVRKLEYVADFRVTYADGHQEIEDVKSPATKTKTYLIKKKLFRKLFPYLIFVEVE